MAIESSEAVSAELTPDSKSPPGSSTMLRSLSAKQSLSQHKAKSYMPNEQAWFALGSVPGKNSRLWNAKWAGGYHEGFSDAIESVAGGMVGVEGKRC